MNTTYTEISCAVPAELADIVAEYLAKLSGNGVCVENLYVDVFSVREIQEPDTPVITSYFSSGDDTSAHLAAITAFLAELSQRVPGFIPNPPRVARVATEDWSSSWKANFKPLRVGRRLLIVPSWEQVTPDPGDIILRLDPGMAFGTGGHETTRLCLELLEDILDDMPDHPSPSVLDVGTGSGILAMAAAKSGARQVFALDIDPEAIEVARQNIADNNLLDMITCDTTPLESLRGTFDVILANILAEELVRLSSLLAERLAIGGSLVLSGILAEKEQLVLGGFATLPLQYRETRRQGEWVAIHYTKAGKL
jgi:ribosomal protein L11 methyltransferase